MIAQGWCAVLPSSQDFTKDPNSIYNYISKESVALLEERFALDAKISWDVTKVFFKLWTREGGISNPFQFNHETTSEELINNNFNPDRPTKILAHGFSDSVEWANPFAEGKLSIYYISIYLIAY